METTLPPSDLDTAAAEQLGERPTPSPAWLPQGQLPPIRVGPQTLTPHQIHAVLNALRDSSPQRPAPLVALLKQHADAESLDAFSVDVCRRWIDAGEPPAHRWALDALGLFGGDGAAAYLAGLLRAWPKQNRHRRATESLPLLAHMGNETAMLELALLARNGKPLRLQQTAAGLLATLAAERGLTRDQLGDRTVPALGLDAEGGRMLRYGARSFSLVIDDNLKPLLRDEKGALRASLPTPNRNDDPDAVAGAKGQWKFLAKQLRVILGNQSTRLEKAMIAGRRWSADEFLRFLVSHPIVGLLVRRLLWATTDARGRPDQVFRVTEDRTFALVDESPLEVAPSAFVCLVHPLHLDEPTRHAWQQALTDHEIVPPFPQLGRPVRTLLPGERDARIIERQRGVKVPSITLVGILDRLGWDRGRQSGQGATAAHWIAPMHVKYYPSADLLAVLQHHPGVPVRGFLRDWEDQALGGCFFVRGVVEPPGGFRTDHAVPLAEVDPVLLSEVLGVVEFLRSRAIASESAPGV